MDRRDFGGLTLQSVLCASGMVARRRPAIINGDRRIHESAEYKAYGKRIEGYGFMRGRLATFGGQLFKSRGGEKKQLGRSG
jgi:hypothetical protein